MDKITKELIDNFIRDVSSVRPMPKSEIRARLMRIIDRISNCNIKK